MPETRADRPVAIFLATLVSYSLFAVMNIFAKLASETHPVMQIMFFRNTIALVPIVTVLMKTGGPALLRTQHPGGHFLRSSLGTISMIFFFLSFAMLPLANATAIQATSPLLQSLLSIPLLGEEVGPHRMTAVGIGLCAVLFMLHPSEGGNWLGSIFALIAAVFSAFIMIIIRRLGRTENPITIVFYFTLFGAICSAAVLPWFWVTPSWQGLIYLAMVGLAGGSAQLFMTWAYANGPTAFVSSFSYISIVLGAIADWVVWHHVIDWHIALGSCIVILTGIYVLYRETLHHRPPAPEAVTLNE
ncbi:MAG TPA: DMT family transporter [Patescibacteria group bacterium]|nr:DMT family transporter [Patescibacteria group bacterium]